MKNKLELWLQNTSEMDVSVSDLGVKVLVGGTINVYKYNPYLTEIQVNKSLEDGALFRRLNSKVLKTVGAPSGNKPNINQVKEGKPTLVTDRGKSSVVIKSTQDVDEETGESFEFADYGVTDLGPSVNHERAGKAVFVKADQDEINNISDEYGLTPTLTNSKDIMKNLEDKLVDPMASLENTVGQTPPTMVKAPVETKPEQIKVTTDTAPKKDESGAILVSKGKGKSKGSARSLKAVKDAKGKDPDVTDADASIEMEETSFDSKVATKTEDGAVVMKLKED